MSCAASGEGCGGASVERGDRYSKNVDGKFSGKTLWFGLNFRASALGVSSVWMKIVRRDCADGRACRTMGWLRDSIVGLCRRLEEDMGVVRVASEKQRVVVDVASRCVLLAVVDGRGSAFARQRIAGFVDIVLGWRVELIS